MQTLLESIKNLQETSQNNRRSCDFFLQALKEWTLTEELYSKNMARISSHSGLKQECFGFIRDYTHQASQKAKHLSEYLSANVIEYFKQLLNSQSNSLKSNFIDTQKILEYIQKKCQVVSESMTKYFSACRECEDITFDLDKDNTISKKEKIFQKAFVEWEEVYQGGYYGTLKSEIERLWSEGKNVIFDVDVKGGLRLKEYFGDNSLAVFVKVPSMEELEKRLVNRGTETEESLSQRLYKVQFEMAFQDQFDVVLLNDDLEKSFIKAQNLYTSFVSNELEIKNKPLNV